MHYSPAALVANGAIHVMGGSPSKQHLIYTPGTGWTTAPDLQDGIGEGAGAQIGQALYVVDGDPGEGIRILDLGTDSWSLGAVRPGDAARGPAAGTDGSSLFVAGGGDGNLVGTNSAYRYDPGPDTWTAIEAMPTARGFIAHATIGQRLYAFGGRNKALTGGTIVAAAEVLDMNSGTWQTLTDMPTKRNSAFAAAVGGSVVVAGGFSGSVKLATIEVYDTTTDTWETCSATMSEAFSAGAAASLNGELYLFGNNQTGLEIGSF